MPKDTYKEERFEQTERDQIAHTAQEGFVLSARNQGGVS